MSDLTITATSVVRGNNSTATSGTAGATITSGQAVYISVTTGQYLLAKADNANTATCAGIALNSCSINQPIQVLTGGNIIIGATAVVGGTYVLSAANAGGIAPVADLASTNIVDFLAIATSATNLFVQILNSGTSHA